MFKKSLISLASVFILVASSSHAADVEGVSIKSKKENRDVLAVETTQLKSSFNGYESFSSSSGTSFNYVDRHLIFAIDGSDSVDSKENSMLLSGIAHAILDNSINYNNCNAMTVVRFSEESHISKTHVFCSMEGAKSFVAEALVNKGKVFNSELGISTDNTSAIIAAGYVWAGEGGDLNFVSNHKDLIFVGDGPDNVDNLIKNPEYIYSTKDLAKRFGATTHAVAIMTPNTQTYGDQISLETENYYRNMLLTPRNNNITYINPVVHGPISLPVRPGYFNKARTFHDVSASLLLILKATLN